MPEAPDLGPLLLPGAAPVFARRWPLPGVEAAVILLHGLESHSAWLERLGGDLAGAGFQVLAYDRRGWGRSEGRSGHLASPQAALLELSQVIARLKDLSPEVQRIHLVGLSWGGLLALFAAEKLRETIISVTALAPPLFLRKSLPLAAQMSVLSGLAIGYPQTLSLPIEVEDFTGIAAAQEFIRSDGYRRTAVSPAVCGATVRMQFAVRSWRRTGVRHAPVLMLLASDDAVVDSQKTAAWAEQAGSALRCETLAATRHSLVFEAAALVGEKTVAFCHSTDRARRGPVPP